MPKYEVTFEVSKSLRFFVEAETPEAAKDVAWERYDDDGEYSADRTDDEKVDYEIVRPFK